MSKQNLKGSPQKTKAPASTPAPPTARLSQSIFINEIKDHDAFMNFCRKHGKAYALIWFRSGKYFDASVEPILEKLGSELMRSLSVARLDLDEPAMAQVGLEYKINGTPAFFVLKTGSNKVEWCPSVEYGFSTLGPLCASIRMHTSVLAVQQEQHGFAVLDGVVAPAPGDPKK